MGARGWHRSTTIPNAPLREAYLASGISASDVCRYMGWETTDTSRLHRRLGVLPSYDSVARGGKVGPQEHISTDLALELCALLGWDFDALYPRLPKDASVGGDAGRCEICRLALVVPVEDALCGFCREVLMLRGLVSA